MARFSFPFIQLAAGIGAAAMIATGQWLGAQEEVEDPSPTPSTQAAMSTVTLRPAGEARQPPPLSSTVFAWTAPAVPAPAVLASAPEAASPADAQPQASEPPGEAAPLSPIRPRLAVIIDDIGHDAEAARALMGADFPVTLAILPYAEAAPVIAAEARIAGTEVFVHLPMEPAGLENPGPGAITTALSPGEIAARVEAALLRVPGAVGVNNHMGSRATRDPGAVAALFDALAGRELIFVDSLTHPDSIAAEAARAAGLAAFGRDVFLDSSGSDPAVQLDAALALARETGQAIAIGHPHPQTLAALTGLAAKADAAGVELVSVSALVGRRDAPS